MNFMQTKGHKKALDELASSLKTIVDASWISTDDKAKVQKLLQTEDSDEDLTLQPQATTSAYETHDGGIRSEVNIELNFPPKLRGARSRLYRRRFLQVNTRWKALAEIYTMHSFAPFSNLNFFVKNRQNVFAIELMNIH